MAKHSQFGKVLSRVKVQRFPDRGIPETNSFHSDNSLKDIISLDLSEDLLGLKSHLFVDFRPNKSSKVCFALVFSFGSPWPKSLCCGLCKPFPVLSFGPSWTKKVLFPLPDLLFCILCLPYHVEIYFTLNTQ